MDEVQSLVQNDPALEYPIEELIIAKIDSWFVDMTNDRAKHDTYQFYAGGIRFGRELLKDLARKLEFGRFLREKAARDAEARYENVIPPGKRPPPMQSRPVRFNHDTVST